MTIVAQPVGAVADGDVIYYSLTIDLTDIPTTPNSSFPSQSPSGSVGVGIILREVDL
ncbi:MAG: hypothetical protein GY835_25385 [bacterium]|nr:hypothetical protein [bacterium]